MIQKGLLKKEEIGIDQVRALLESAAKNLNAAKKTFNIDEEACYTMAYNSMLKTARAVIFLKGYRPDDGQQHKTTVEVAGKILGSNFRSLTHRFDRMRKKRNQFTYEPLLPLGKTETKSALITAENFYNKVKKQLHRIDSQKRLF